MKEWVNWPGMSDDLIGSWVIHPNRYRYNRCDRCGKRRFFFRLYDVWPKKLIGHFGWVCADCLIDLITYIEEDLRERTLAK